MPSPSFHRACTKSRADQRAQTRARCYWTFHPIESKGCAIFPCYRTRRITFYGPVWGRITTLGITRLSISKCHNKCRFLNPPQLQLCGCGLQNLSRPQYAHAMRFPAFVHSLAVLLSTGPTKPLKRDARPAGSCFAIGITRAP